MWCALCIDRIFPSEIYIFLFLAFFLYLTASTSGISSEIVSTEMPPRRKRKTTTKEETKLKKQREDCVTR